MFELIVKNLELEPCEMDLGGGRKCKVVFLKDVQTVIGYEEDTFQGGIFTRLKVWHFFFELDFKPEDFRRGIHDNDPALKITAGPFSAGIWAHSLGQKLVETVKIEFGSGTYGNGFRLDNPIIPSMTAVMNMAVGLMEDKRPTELLYWEAFKNPDADHSKPP
jgi:hypothetical protein